MVLSCLEVIHASRKNNVVKINSACPACGEIIILTDDLRKGESVFCRSCDQESFVQSLQPPRLIAISEEDD